MHILLNVLGWTLLALLALLALVLVLPVRAELEYREGALSVRARIFGLPLRIYPFPERLKKRRPKQKQPQKEAAPRPKKKKKRAPRLETEEIQAFLGAAGTFMRRMYRMIHITDVILILPVHREDAAQTALACGRAEAWLAGMTALLQNYFDLHIVQLRVLPDFTNEITAGVYLSCGIGAPSFAAGPACGPEADAACPACGHIIAFAQTDGAFIFTDRSKSSRYGLIEILPAQIGII